VLIQQNLFILVGFIGVNASKKKDRASEQATVQMSEGFIENK
jgi:hypothetical protein